MRLAGAAGIHDLDVSSVIAASPAPPPLLYIPYEHAPSTFLLAPPPHRASRSPQRGAFCAPAAPAASWRAQGFRLGHDDEVCALRPFEFFCLEISLAA